MYNIRDVAETVLSFESVTHKKLQKLCYYICAWHYTVFNIEICDAEFEAWVHGPVSPELYYQYKKYGWGLINQTKDSALPYRKVEFIKNILNIYGGLDADQLEDMTHDESPWKNARKGLSKWAHSDNKISNEDIYNYYTNEKRDIFNHLQMMYSQ